MTRRSGIAMILVSALIGTAPPENAPPAEEPKPAPPKIAELGKPVPDFSLQDSSGQQRTLSSFKGKIVVLEWVNPRCPLVQDSYRIKTMQTAWRHVKELDKGVVWLAINSTINTNAAENNAWIRQYGLTYPILIDERGRVGRRFAARRTPHMFVIDREGVLRYHGAIDDNRFSDKPPQKATIYVVNAVKQIVEEQVVSPGYVAPYGSSVQY